MLITKSQFFENSQYFFTKPPLTAEFQRLFLRQDNKIYIDICPFFIIFHFSVPLVPSVADIRAASIGDFDIDYFLLIIDYFFRYFRENAGNETTSFRPKPLVVGNKNEKS